MSRCPTFTFQVSIMSKWLGKHISTEVSFKITIRITHVNIDIRWPWIWNQYFYLGILNDHRSFAFISAPCTILNIYDCKRCMKKCFPINWFTQVFLWLIVSWLCIIIWFTCVYFLQLILWVVMTYVCVSMWLTCSMTC